MQKVGMKYEGILRANGKTTEELSMRYGISFCGMSMLKKLFTYCKRENLVRVGKKRRKARIITYHNRKNVLPVGNICL